MNRFLLIILFCVLALFLSDLYSGDIVDTSFNLITETNNIEYSGAEIKLSFSGIEFIKGSGTKDSILDRGYPGFASWHVAHPSVIKDGPIYKMWLSGYDTANWRIGYATSYNGIDWSIYSNSTLLTIRGAVLGRENTKGFASTWAYKPCVLKDGSLYRMWYTGSDSVNYRIGYAVSYDGLNWTLYSNRSIPGLKGAVLGKENTSNAFASVDVEKPMVIKDGTGYKMWFIGSDGPNRRVGYASSSDGTNWSVYSNAAISGLKGAVLGKENVDCAFASTSIVASSVIKDGGIYKMWFEGFDGVCQRIGNAVSYDGITWTTEAYNALPSLKGAFIGKENAPSFASLSVYAPYFIKELSEFKLWFGGDDGNYRLGLAGETCFLTGSFTSRILDPGQAVNFDRIYFSADTGTDHEIKFQIRKGKTLAELNSAAFEGPAGNPLSYYVSSGQELDTDFTNVRYIQYKAYLSTADQFSSPLLYNVKFAYSDPASAPDAPVNEDKKVYAYPNPLDLSTGSKLALRYSLESPVPVEISIFNPSGREVWSKTVIGNTGWNIEDWDGKDRNGKGLGSGLYFVIIKKKYSEGDFLVRNKILLIK
jgi:hypothetical protein